MSEDNWVASVRKQEEEEAENRSFADKQMLAQKMKELHVKSLERQSDSSTKPQQAQGWPTLPGDAKPRSESVGGYSESSNNDNNNPPQKKEGGWPNLSQPGGGGIGIGSGGITTRPSGVGGAGRGKPFSLRGNTQSSGGIGGFSSLGTTAAGGFGGNGGGNRSFGQFGGFNSGGSGSASSPIRAASSNGSNFSFKSTAADSPFKSSNAPSNAAAGSSFGTFGNFGNSAASGGGGASNWPNLDKEKKSEPVNSSSPMPSTEWPKVDNFSDHQQKVSTVSPPQPRQTTNFGAAAAPTSFGQSANNWGGNTQQQQEATATGEEEDGENGMDKAEASYLNKILHDKLVNTKYDVEIERQNPNNPLFSVKSFEELRLSDELLKGVWEMGFRYPSKIQESALPALLADPPQNMIAQSQSGTGKTAAFVLTMLSRVDPTQQYPQCLCLSPTYELALQIGKVVEQMGKYLTDVKLAYAVRGGTRLERGARITEQIVIGTPGTVLDWALRFRFFDPKLISVFVLDEADLMIGMQGHQDQSIRIHKLLPATCQHLLFSATYDDEVMDFAYKIIIDPVVIRLRREEETLDYIKQYYVTCRTREDKYKALCTIYGTLTIGQAIIFCRTKKEANWLAGQMSGEGHSVSLLSAELSIEQRAAIFERFKRGDEKVLISTNLTARGIDVKQVNIVINYDLPTTKDGQPDFEAYLHRIGRSGRFGKPGIAINFIDNNWSRNLMDQIQGHFGKDIVDLDVEDVDALEKIESWD